MTTSRVKVGGSAYLRDHEHYRIENLYPKMVVESYKIYMFGQQYIGFKMKFKTGFEMSFIESDIIFIK